MTLKTYEFTTDLIIDIEPTQNIRFFQNDHNSAHLIFFITDRKQPVNLTNAKVKIVLQKPDGTIVFQDNCTPIDAAIGKYEVILNTQTLVVDGTAYGQIHIEDGDKILECRKFELYIDKSILSQDAIESTNDFLALQKAIQVGNQLEGMDIPSIIGAAEIAKESLEISNNNTNEIVTLKNRTSNEVSVLEFGADPTGKTKSTEAFRQAASYCATNRKNLKIPDGDFWIDGSLPFPNYYAVIGNGYYSNIVVDLPSGEVVWKESTSFRYGWGFENLRFTVKPNSSKDVGCIYLESSMRGAYIKNIWSYDLRSPLYLGDKVWGIVSVDNLFFYLLGENLDSTQNTAAFLAKGNTIMMSNIEIVGGWTRGLCLDGVSVFKLNGYNVSGSSTSIQMSQAIYIENSDSGEITSGWIEQLVDNTNSANGRPIWNNGEGHAIYVKNSEAITIGESNISTGSIYCDNSKLTIDQIKYAQSNAGIKMVNNGKVNATESAIKSQNIAVDFTKSDGEIILNTRSTSAMGLLDNPIMKTGIPHALTVTNGTLVTMSDEVTDYLSGDRAIKVTISANYHGVFINKSNLKVGKLYTAVVKVKKINGLDSISVISGTSTSVSTKYPGTLTRSGTSEYHLLYYPFTATSNSITVKIQGIMTSGQTTGTFLVESADIFEGYNVYDSSQQNQAILGEQGRLKANSAPVSGSWDVGNKISISSPTANGYIGHVCIASGSPGTWKGYGQIQA